MLYVVYNHDGSLKYTNLNEIITQGSTTTKLLVSVEGYNTSGYTAIAYCILPNGSSSAVEGELTTDEDTGITGFEFALTQDETYYYGELQMSVKLYIAGTDTILFTIPIHLTINKTGFVANSTNITITQYTNLVDTLNTLDSEKLDKQTSDGADYVYGVNASSEQVMFALSNAPTNNHIPVYNADGQIKTEAPNNNKDCANKKYVDDYSTLLYKHEIAIEGDFNDDLGYFNLNVVLITTHADKITLDSQLYNALNDKISVYGYFQTEDYYDDIRCDILDIYENGNNLFVIFYVPGEGVLKRLFNTTGSYDDNHDKL